MHRPRAGGGGIGQRSAAFSASRMHRTRPCTFLLIHVFRGEIPFSMRCLSQCITATLRGRGRAADNRGLARRRASSEFVFGGNVDF